MEYLLDKLIFESPVGVHALDKTYPHYHRSYEVCYLVGEEERQYFIDHTLYRVTSGDIVLVPKGAMHRTSPVSDSYERYFIFIPEGFFENDIILNCFKKTNHLRLQEAKRIKVKELFEKIESEFQNPDEYSKMLIKNYIRELLLLFGRYADQQHSFSEELEISEIGIQNAARYICTNFHNNISMTEVANIAYMSPSHFSRKFKEVTGFGFSTYLNNIRANNAKTYLTITNMTIGEIAQKCGFNDANYFGDAFKRVTGMSPSAYRKIKQKKEDKTV